MKIAMIGSRGIGSYYGGVETVLDSLCPCLASYGHTIDIFSRHDVQFENTDRLRAIRIKTPQSKHLETIMRSVIALRHSLNKYDVIHFHSIGSGILSPISTLAGQKSVITIHGLDSERDKWGFIAKQSLKLAEKTLVSHCDAITVVSRQLRKYFIEKYDIKTSYIPNASNERLYVEPKELSLKFGLVKKRYILFSSRLTPEKGAHDLITAFNELETDFKLVIAGCSGSEEYYKKLLNISNKKKVVFTGHLRGDDLWELYSNAYLFVLPSYLEGMSMALLEAMSFNLAPLVSNIKENTDVIGEDGFTFENKNISDLKLKINYLIQNNSLVDNVEERLRNRKKQDWYSIASEYDKIYRKIARENYH